MPRTGVAELQNETLEYVKSTFGQFAKSIDETQYKTKYLALEGWKSFLREWNDPFWNPSCGGKVRAVRILAEQVGDSEFNGASLFWLGQ